MVDFPFGPCATVHPNAAIFHPIFVLDFIDSGKDGIETNFVSSVRVGQIAGNENLMGFYRFDQIFYNLYIGFGEIAFFNGSGLIERQVEEVYVLRFNTDIVTCRTCLALTNHRLDETNIGRIGFPVFLLTDEFMYLVAFLQKLGSIEFEFLGNVVDQHDVTHHIFVTHSDITRSFVCHVYIVFLVGQSFECAAHRNHIVIGVRTEYDHSFGIRFGTLRTECIVGVGFSSGPTGNRVL